MNIMKKLKMEILIGLFQINFLLLWGLLIIENLVKSQATLLKNMQIFLER